MSLGKNISRNQIVGYAVTIASLSFAVYIGMLVGNQDFGILIGILGCIAGAMFFGLASAYWIWLAFAWAVFGFLIRPLGPMLSGLHIALALAGVFILAYAWRRHPAGSVTIQLDR